MCAREPWRAPACLRQRRAVPNPGVPGALCVCVCVCVPSCGPLGLWRALSACVCCVCESDLWGYNLIEYNGTSNRHMLTTRLTHVPLKHSLSQPPPPPHRHKLPPTPPTAHACARAQERERSGNISSLLTPVSDH